MNGVESENNSYYNESKFNVPSFCKNLANDALSEEDFGLLGKYLENIISTNFLKKEYYPNNKDGSNKEIEKIRKLSPNDIEQRKSEGKGLFYMNPCMSQTLYLINILKEKIPDLSDKINLCIEFLLNSDNGLRHVHSFTQIKFSDDKSVIIDYSRGNNVYIYSGGYTNKLGHNTQNIISIPASDFSKNDNIFDIAQKYFSQLEKETKIPGLGKQKMIDIQQMTDSIINKILLDNSVPGKFEKRNEENSALKIHNGLSQ